MVEILKQNWIFIAIVGLSFFLLLNINPHLLAFLGSLLLIDLSYDFRSRFNSEYAANGHSWKYWWLSAICVVLVFAALLLFKYYS